MFNASRPTSKDWNSPGSSFSWMRRWAIAATRSIVATGAGSPSSSMTKSLFPGETSRIPLTLSTPKSVYANLGGPKWTGPRAQRRPHPRLLASTAIRSWLLDATIPSFTRVRSVNEPACPSRTRRLPREPFGFRVTRCLRRRSRRVLPLQQRRPPRGRASFDDGLRVGKRHLGLDRLDDRPRVRADGLRQRHRVRRRERLGEPGVRWQAPDSHDRLPLAGRQDDAGPRARRQRGGGPRTPGFRPPEPSRLCRNSADVLGNSALPRFRRFAQCRRRRD